VNSEAYLAGQLWKGLFFRGRKMQATAGETMASGQTTCSEFSLQPYPTGGCLGGLHILYHTPPARSREISHLVKNISLRKARKQGKNQGEKRKIAVQN